MRRAVIVSTARTPIGRAYRGAFNDTQAQALAGHAIAEAVKRAGIDPAEIDDVQLAARRQPSQRAGQHGLPARDHRQAVGHENAREARHAEQQRGIERRRVGAGYHCLASEIENSPLRTRAGRPSTNFATASSP